MRMVDIIIKKKLNQKLTEEEIKFFVNGYVSGDIPDYQVSALLMAIYFNKLDDEEIFALTNAMLESGERMDLSSIDGICVDKHSTGGVGDKTSLVVGPVVASCGLKLAKMSGRGLGHTGGTLDKLESIPGLSINKDINGFYDQVKKIGIAIVGQTKNICPADKKLYALRDVTGTVDNIGLISSSIMCKKLASGASTIVLDVKVGDGSFMKDVNQATELAEELVKIGKNAKDFKRNVIAVLTDMDEPLGEMVGNSLEVIEAIEVLKGRGPKRFRELCEKICVELLTESGFIKDASKASKLVREKLENGESLEKFKQMIYYQGGDPRVVDDYSLLPIAKEKIEIKAKKDGYIARVEALKVGVAAMLLGAGRENKDEDVDPGVGIQVLKSVGDKVNKGDVIGYAYTNGKKTQEAIDMVLDAYSIVNEKVDYKPVILGIIK